MDSEVVEIKKGSYYTSPNSDLLMKIIKIYYVGDTYIKVKGELSNKKNHIVYETKQYKLIRSQIMHWVALSCGVCTTPCGNEWCCANN